MYILLQDFFHPFLASTEETQKRQKLSQAFFSSLYVRTVDKNIELLTGLQH
jgi:hypothetical protein